MNLVILDSAGNEVSFERVSLTPGGIEIVLGELDSAAISVAPAEIPQADVAKIKEAHVSEAPAAPLAAVPNAADVAPSAPSVFDTPVQEVVQQAKIDAEADKQGVPWDERIHSSSKKQTGKGLWAKRKNLPDGLYEQVTAELLSGQPQPTPAPVSQERPVPVAPADNQVAAGQQAVPPLPDVPTQVVAAVETPAVPAAPQIPAVPAVPAPLPDDNQIGDANDSALSGILSAWGQNS